MAAVAAVGSVAAVIGAAGLAMPGLPDRAEVRRLSRQAPKTTALIEARAEAARRAGREVARRQIWVDLDAISPALVACVLAAEDARFFVHTGLDYTAIREAIHKDVERRRFVRGASTITQQLAKNLFLSEQKTVLRKIREVRLAAWLEDDLTKERILTLYLNVVEWGDGVYGVEAAARAHLWKSAAALTLAEAATLAAMLPSPRRLSQPAGRGDLERRAVRVLERVEEEGWARPDAIAAARDQVRERPAGAPGG